jgi:tRNA(fMet)-specific endonuclease VapC
MDPTGTVIDTDILIDLLKNTEETVTFLAEIEENETPLSTTAINAFELYYGAHKSKQQKQNLKATTKLLNRLIILPLDQTSAETAGHIYAELETKGQPIGLRDSLIAAITLTNGFRIATKNVKHLQKITGLTVITPP